MPDEDSSGGIEHKGAEYVPDGQTADPQTSPEDSHSTARQRESSQQVQHEVQQIEDRVKRAERWMIGLTFAIAFSGFCAVVVGILQWSAMRGQLREMKSGGIDTHDLAVAAGKQADAAVISQRPWLKVTASIAGPFVFDQYGARVTIGFRIENTGHSTAFGIQLKDGLGAAGSKLPDPFAERLTLCDAVQKEPEGRGDTLFPGDHLDIESMLVMQPDRLRDALIVTSEKDQPRSNPALPSPIFRDYIVDGEEISKGTIMPEVFGCVDYEFGLAKGHHQTRFVYMINGPRMKPSLGIIPPAKLSISPDPRVGIETN